MVKYSCIIQNSYKCIIKNSHFRNYSLRMRDIRDDIAY